MITSFDGAFKTEHRIDICFNLVAEALQNFKRKFFKSTLALSSRSNRLTDDVVGCAERNTVTDKIISIVLITA